MKDKITDLPFGECVNENDKKKKRLERVQKRKTMSYEAME